MDSSIITERAIDARSGCVAIKMSYAGAIAANATIDNANDAIVATIEQPNKSMPIVSLGLVCSVGIGEWEYLKVKEGDILLIDGERVLVKRK